jgi:hypothetical protein
MVTSRRMWAVQLVLVLSGMAFGTGASKSQTAAAPKWPNWRGPNRDGVSTEKVAAWPKEGPRQLWTAELGLAIRR